MVGPMTSVSVVSITSLPTNRDVNILVMDTEVYSNTGGQKSKATPRAATAKFATGGKSAAKKDLGLIAADYGHVYVGANFFRRRSKNKPVKAMQEAAAHKGPSILVAYATCIAHGFDLTYTIEHMRAATDSGYWPLYRYDPNLRAVGRNPMQIDSRRTHNKLQGLRFNGKPISIACQDQSGRGRCPYGGRSSRCGQALADLSAPGPKR